VRHSLVVLAAAAPLSLSGYPIVADVAGVPVRAPAESQAWGACPTGALPINPAELRSAKRAVVAALPTLAKRPKPPLKLQGARVTLVSHTRRTGFIMPSRRACWGTPFLRSALVQVFLPAERASPSLRGNPWFYVARTQRAWVIWDAPR
jgi:hypothetical protein